MPFSAAINICHISINTVAFFTFDYYFFIAWQNKRVRSGVGWAGSATLRRADGGPTAPRRRPDGGRAFFFIKPYQAALFYHLYSTD